MITRLPVFFLNSAGEAVAPVEGGKPHIRIALFRDPAARISEMNDCHTFNALLDTGSGFCAIHMAEFRKVIDAFDYVAKNRVEVTSVHGVTQNEQVSLACVLKEHRLNIEVPFTVLGVSETVRTSSPVILGVDFLALGSLHLDFKGNDFYFEVVH